MSSVDYITQLKFEYIETYSFQRGQDYDDRKREFSILSRQKKLSLEQQKKNDELLHYSDKMGLLLDEDGRFNKSSVRINTFKKDSTEVKLISSILKTPVINIPMWMCAPFYRDAIVFYNAGAEIVSVLNICFSCEYMETKEFHHVNADAKTYKELRSLFLGIGHPVENK